LPSDRCADSLECGATAKRIVSRDELPQVRVGLLELLTDKLSRPQTALRSNLGSTTGLVMGKDSTSLVRGTVVTFLN